MPEQEQEQTALVAYGEIGGDLYAPEGAIVSTPELDASLRPTNPVGRPDEDRRVLLNLKLVQKPNLPAMGCVPGEWFYQGTATRVQNPRIVLLDYLKDGQVFWDEYDPSNPHPVPLCWSDNGREPGTESERRPMSAPETGPCFVPGKKELSCLRNIWKDNPTPGGKRIKPECTRQRKMLVAFISPVDGEWLPAVWEMHGAAMKFAKSVVTTKMDTRACKAVFVLDTEHKQEPGFDFQVPRMVELMDLEAPGRTKAKGMRDEVNSAIAAGELFVETEVEVERTDADEVEEDAIPF